MAREDQLVEALTLADTLVDHYDIIDSLQTLAERCVELVDVSAAESCSPTRSASCDTRHARTSRCGLVSFELQVEEGPCFDAYRTQAP